MPDLKPMLLLQARDADDPIRFQEVGCFHRLLETDSSQLEVKSLFDPVEERDQLQRRKAIFVGGSGDYSIAHGGDWLANALAWMQTVVELSRPTFASCFGFQAMALALGGSVRTDLESAEVGTIELTRTAAARDDSLFAPLPERFLGQAGHQDIVDRLPSNAILLASTEKTKNQAFRLEGLPIYCSQFHPELDLDSLLERIRNYPEYVEKIAGIPYQQFADQCRETPDSNQILPRFVKQFVVSAGGR